MNLENIQWDSNKGVPITDNTKLRWIEEMIKFLKDNPDEIWTGMSSGDTYIKVTRDDTFYDIQEFEPRRWAMLSKDDDDVSACSCSIAILNKTGCQCGGI
jgi:hypothetical protein